MAKKQHQPEPVATRGRHIVKFIILALLAVFISPIAQAEPPHLRDRQTGKYLGTLSANPYDPDSVNNPYGRYGSSYSADSINNPYGQYGSRYSNDSPNNPYATNTPGIYGGDEGGRGY
jgi:hypothetical protein